LEGALAARLYPHQAGIENQRADRPAVVAGARLDIENGLAHQDETLDHPIDRSAVDQFGGATGQVAGVGAQGSLFAGARGSLPATGLDLAEMVEAFDPDGHAQQVNGHRA